VSILLVDDHKVLRDGLRAILEAKGFSVLGEAGSGHEALEQAHRLKPKIVVMDISMPGLNGVDATRRLVSELPGTKVIGLSMNSDRRYVSAMFEAGASGYLLKNSAAEELVDAIRTVARDLSYVSPLVAAYVVGQCVEHTRAMNLEVAKPLSTREREVLQLLAEGKASKDIASQLSLALPTIESHRRQIMDKLNLRTIAELTKYAVREGLTSLD
jgi:two-component system, NarL family, response regulator NreC